MGPLSLRFLRQAVDPRISGYELRLIKRSASPSTVHRVALDYPQGHPGARSVILKLIAPAWPEDLNGPDREISFYGNVLPCLDLRQPRVFYAGPDPESDYRLIVLEDMADSHRFPPPTHVWTPAEGRCLLRAYAQLHVQGRQLQGPGIPLPVQGAAYG